MDITNLQKNNPNIKFYELKDDSDIGYLSVKKIEDFLQLVRVVGYIEIKVDNDDASTVALESIIDAYCSLHRICRSDKNAFADYVDQNLTNKLEKLISCSKAYNLLKLYALDAKVKYEEEHSLNNNDYNLAIKIIR